MLKVVVRAIETDLIHRAGLTRSSRARTGVITLIQRFGSALNLNIHLHMIVLDGVYAETDGRLRFHRVGAPPSGTLERLLGRIIRRTLRLLVRNGALVEDPEQPWLTLQDPDTLDQLSADSKRAQRDRCDEAPVKADPNQALVAPLTWAQRLRRVFDIDVSTCPFCGGRINSRRHSSADSSITSCDGHCSVRAS